MQTEPTVTPSAEDIYRVWRADRRLPKPPRGTCLYAQDQVVPPPIVRNTGWSSAKSSPSNASIAS